MNKLTINLGTNKLPRFSCACHKCNLSVRYAIRNYVPLCSILIKLTRFAGSIKHSINIMKIHVENKACLRCENLTRWSSTFMMLEAFKKCYEKDVFSEA